MQLTLRSELNSWEEKEYERNSRNSTEDQSRESFSRSEPFTWASGIISPIYCDNRLLLSYRKEWGVVMEAMREVVEKEFPDAECIMGTAAAGIPHASVLAYLMEKPSGFVRGKAKDHGRKNQIEGKIHEGMKVVVIEDLISTGGSSIEVVEALREAGCDVLGMVSHLHL